MEGREEVPPGFSQLIVHHGLDPEQSTLSDLDDFRKQFCQHCSLCHVVLMFRSVHFGSAKVVWLIPSHVVKHLHAEVKNPDQVLWNKNGVLGILINGVRACLASGKNGGRKDSDQSTDV